MKTLIALRDKYLDRAVRTMSRQPQTPNRRAGVMYYCNAARLVNELIHRGDSK